ncbi:MAG TPA: hypothetical protein PLF59_08075, partial [Cyclobacteriaceae bacterium]|nr:hypothetical protein [Cyclobacteriaceae bacterium]
VNIKPLTNPVIIGGMNGQGKSSVLDSIMYALAGAKALPEKPIREGQEKLNITITIDGYNITRTCYFKENGEMGSTVEIKKSNGERISSPQTFLDSLAGKMVFDPLEFSRLKPKDQLERLKALVKLDFSDLDGQKQRAYDERTEVNREIKFLESKIKKIDYPGTMTEISVEELLSELEQINEKNREYERVNREVLRQAEKCNSIKREITLVEAKIIELQARIESLTQERNKEQDALTELQIISDSGSLIDIAEINDKIKNAEAINVKVRESKEQMRIDADLRKLTATSESLTKNITDIDKKKESMMAEAVFPVPGLGYNENGITFNGLPFDQASSAQRLQVSVAMGIALNPKLRIMLIRDGSLLDEESLQVISEMVQEADIQLWIERVGTSGNGSIIIDDGCIKKEWA